MLIARYILRAHIGPFLFGTLTIIMLFLLQYMMRFVDELASKGLGGWVITQFILLNLSWIVVLAVPIGVLFSTLMAFGAMSANNEVTVFKASGVGLFQMMRPVMLFGIVLWAFTFWFTDNVLPDSNLKLSTLGRDISRTKPTFAIDEGEFTTAVDGFTILARRVDSNGVLYGVTIYDHSRPERSNIVNADTAKLAFTPSASHLIMQLFHGEIHQQSRVKPNDYRLISFDRHQISMSADRFFFQQSDASGSSRSDREMRISDMRVIVDRANEYKAQASHRIDSLVHDHIAYLASPAAKTSATQPTSFDSTNAVSNAQARVSFIRSQIESESFRRIAERDNARRYEVEIQKKYAIPFACILFVFVGCPLGIITRGGNFGISAGVSLIFYVVYWATLIGGEKLADRDLFSPTLAMWLGNIILAVVGILVSIKVNYETTPVRAVMLWLQRKRA